MMPYISVQPIMEAIFIVLLVLLLMIVELLLSRVSSGPANAKTS